MLKSVLSPLLCLALLLPGAAMASDATESDRNAALVAQAFEDWKNGRGNLFDLLADDAEWTVAGNSPVSGIYLNRQTFLDDAVRPIIARLATPITPEVQHIIAQGEHVVVTWNGTATAVDGSPYTNQYAWHLQMEEGRITRVVAFLDTWALQQLMED